MTQIYTVTQFEKLSNKDFLKSHDSNSILDLFLNSPSLLRYVLRKRLDLIDSISDDNLTFILRNSKYDCKQVIRAFLKDYLIDDKSETFNFRIDRIIQLITNKSYFTQMFTGKSKDKFLQFRPQIILSENKTIVINFMSKNFPMKTMNQSEFTKEFQQYNSSYRDILTLISKQYQRDFIDSFDYTIKSQISIKLLNDIGFDLNPLFIRLLTKQVSYNSFSNKDKKIRATFYHLEKTLLEQIQSNECKISDESVIQSFSTISNEIHILLNEGKEKFFDYLIQNSNEKNKEISFIQYMEKIRGTIDATIIFLLFASSHSELLIKSHSDCSLREAIRANRTKVTLLYQTLNLKFSCETIKKYPLKYYSLFYTVDPETYYNEFYSSLDESLIQNEYSFLRKLIDDNKIFDKLSDVSKIWISLKTNSGITNIISYMQNLLDHNIDLPDKIVYDIYRLAHDTNSQAIQAIRSILIFMESKFIKPDRFHIVIDGCLSYVNALQKMSTKNIVIHQTSDEEINVN